MPVTLNRPNKESALDKIAKGLNIAQSAFGIASNIGTINNAIQSNKIQADKAAVEREAFLKQQTEDDDAKNPESALSKQSQEAFSARGIKDAPGKSKTQLVGQYGDAAALYKTEFDTNQKMRLSRAEEAAKANNKPSETRLPSDKVLAVQEGGAVLGALPDLRKSIEQNADAFGPIMGRAGALNPYNEQAQTLDAQMRAQAQAFGRYMEGGVLRKEDEDKYRKMFPQTSDTPELAMNKLELVERQLARKHSSDIDALKRSGYDVSGFNAPGALPDVPKAIAGITPPKEDRGLFPKAIAEQKTKFSNEDLEAVAWLKQNPKHPKAGEVRATLRQKGLQDGL